MIELYFALKVIGSIIGLTITIVYIIYVIWRARR